MADRTIEFEVKLKKNEESIKNLADSFENRIQSGVDRVVKSLNLDKFAPLKSGSTGSGGSAIAGGIAGGIAAGATLGVLNVIADAVKDIPIITAIMKMFKLIIEILFIPLIPILKPVLLLLGKFASAILNFELATGLIKGGKTNENLKTGAEGVASIVSPAVAPQFFLSLLGGSSFKKSLDDFFGGIGTWLGKFIGGIDTWLGQFLSGAGQFISGFIQTGATMLSNFGVFVGQVVNFIKKIPSYLSDAFAILGSVGQWLWDNIIIPGFNILLGIGKWLWDNIIVAGFNVLLSVGKWLWDNIITPGWNFLSNVGSLIWNQILKPAWSWFYGVGDKIWSIISSGFNSLVSAIQDVVNRIKNALISLTQPIGNFFGSVGNAIGNVIKVHDFIKTPSGVIQTDPNDFLIGTKNPKGLIGGSQTININIDKPTLTSQNDINNLVRQISMVLYKEKRRANSYV